MNLATILRRALPAVLALAFATAHAETPPTLALVKPQYLSPADLDRVLAVQHDGARDVVEWRAADGVHSVEVRHVDGANQVILAGTPDDLASLQALVRAADVPPRQIAIEARVVEVDESRARDLGIQWDHIGVGGNFRQIADWNSAVRRSTADGTFGRTEQATTDRQRDGQVSLGSNASIQTALQLLDQNGAATYRDAPRILTLNNHRATILDGQHVTYVTRYSAYANLYETDSLEAGLRLSVLPSLGESGYLTLDLRAELTSLRSDISGSPVKDGQVVENTVMVKDGESVLLGGFTRTVDEVSHRRVPLLGSVLPVLFSRDVRNRTQRQTFFVITPRVVDLATALDPATKDKVEGH